MRKLGLVLKRLSETLILSKLLYKDKKDQNDNLSKKMPLCKARELQESVDFVVTNSIMKQIQDVETDNHVPRKYSDKI
jgi:hypothetical protein